ncbi:MAG: hypothetical protein D6803_01690, partial [Anaerolineae bacterium]
MSQRERRRQRSRRKKQRQRMTLVMIVAGVALIVAAILIIPGLRSVPPVGELIEPPAFERSMASGNAMGDPNAPVVIHEYSDFGCPHCAHFAQDTEPALEELYIATGKVYFVSHSVGGLLGSDKSVQLAEAAYCAGDQNRYWEFHDYVFANQAAIYADRNAPADGYIAAIAERLGLDMETFNTCLKRHTHRDRVMQDQGEAI